MVFGGTGSVGGGTGWYLVVLGQWEAALVGTWWYWVSRRQYWLVLGGTGPIEGGTGRYMMVLGQGGITCGAIDEPKKSSKAIDERVIINFRDKNVVIARFRDKNVECLFIYYGVIEE